MLPILAALAVVPQTAGSIQEPSTDPEENRSVIYYDYVEDGVLKGGVVPIDPSNPHHVDTGEFQAASASDWETVIDNGPPANRIDIVVVGDGYTAAQLGSYANHVDNILPTFFDEAPLDTYATYFNVHRVDVISIESGVDNDPNQGILKNTALDMGYWCGGTERLLCVNVGKANSEANVAPERDQVLALANSTKYGGAGYTNLGTLAGNNSASIEIALHEFGHSFANLADEYTYGGPSVYTGPEPSAKNVSIYESTEMASLMTKWHLWLDHTQVDTYVGGMYSQSGIYRPTSNSLMRNLGRPFQVVNRERFIRNIYVEIDPIDDATAPGTKSLTHTFFVTPMQPVGHSLDVQWSLDGAPLAGATGTTFDAATLGLSGGPYTLSVEVVDNTTMVRSETMRANHMTSERSWTLMELGPAQHTGPVLDGGSSIALEGVPALGSRVVFVVEPDEDALESGAVPTLFLSSARKRAGLTRASAPARLELALGSHLLARIVGPASSEPVTFDVRVPNDAALVGMKLYAQVLWRAPGRSGRWIDATPALETTIGG